MDGNDYFLIIATLVQTGVLIWGLRFISSVLNTETGNTTFAAQVLSEKRRSVDGKASKADGEATEPTGSFSRIAGSIGATVLAAFFAGVSYWALFNLFRGGDLGKLDELESFFLVGAALFAPYAFNQIRSIFQA